MCVKPRLYKPDAVHADMYACTEAITLLHSSVCGNYTASSTTAAPVAKDDDVMSSLLLQSYLSQVSLLENSWFVPNDPQPVARRSYATCGSSCFRRLFFARLNIVSL